MPRKAKNPRGALFLSAPATLVDAIDGRVEEERLAHPGRTITRSDVIREILWRALVPDPPSPSRS